MKNDKLFIGCLKLLNLICCPNRNLDREYKSELICKYWNDILNCTIGLINPELDFEIVHSSIKIQLNLLSLNSKEYVRSISE